MSSDCFERYWSNLSNNILNSADNHLGLTIWFLKRHRRENAIARGNAPGVLPDMVLSAVGAGLWESSGIISRFSALCWNFGSCSWGVAPGYYISPPSALMTKPFQPTVFVSQVCYYPNLRIEPVPGATATGAQASSLAPALG